MQSRSEVVDVALIGGGIMSTTLGVLLQKVMPDRSIVLFERQSQLATESSGPWNNAGTGHSGLCELNYMPDPDAPEMAGEIAAKFAQSLAFWDALTGDDELDTAFMSPVPHMNVVFGDTDADYLRRRWNSLRSDPAFGAMEFSEDRTVIEEWAPLLVEGRPDGERIAATRHGGGTDIDFGALATSLAKVMESGGALIRTGHDVTGLRRGADGIWTVSGRVPKSRRTFEVRARFVFVGAGGYALRLLQKSGIAEIRGYGVFPIGARFLRTNSPGVVDRHHAKVYGKSTTGAPPMSLPHMDRRVVDGNSSLMFGPYATFSTRLLKNGGLLDFFRTVRPHNVAVLLTVGLQNFALARYLVGQLVASRAQKFSQLQAFYPKADASDWYPIQAGQRAQLIKPTSRTRGKLMFGTEIVSDADGSIAGLLGASPGASVAPSAMIDVLGTCFDADRAEWQPRLEALMADTESDITSSR